MAAEALSAASPARTAETTLPPTSRHITALQDALRAGDLTALPAFWRVASATGTPLIEACPGRPEHSLVTFVWRDSDASGRIAVRAPLDATGQDDHALAHLPGTDVWFAGYCLRDDFSAGYKFVVRRPPNGDEVEVVDALNPRTSVEPLDPERVDQSADDVDSVVALPASPAQAWQIDLNSVNPDRLKRFEFHSERLGNDRRVWVYTPPGYDSERGQYGALVVLDGRFFAFAVRAPEILDALITAGRIAPRVAILVDNPGETWQSAMDARDTELDCHRPCADFLANELLPWARARYAIAADPSKTLIAGSSLGGLAAMFAALTFPQSFGKVISLSGSFWFKSAADVEWEWLTRQWASAPLRPAQFYLEVGLWESQPKPNVHPGQVLANRHLRDVLQARGYAVHYREGMHGHDPIAWPAALAEGLSILTPAV